MGKPVVVTRKPARRVTSGVTESDRALALLAR
jgi:hypothetical protein